jgi:hypothetical protein
MGIKVLVKDAIVFEVVVGLPGVLIITITKPLNEETHRCFPANVTSVIKDSLNIILISIDYSRFLGVLYGAKERVHTTRMEGVFNVSSNMFTQNIITSLLDNTVGTKELRLKFGGSK